MNDKWYVLVPHATAPKQVISPVSLTTARSFVRCITKPGTSLTPNDEACLMRCTDRFLEVRIKSPRESLSKRVMGEKAG